MKRVAVATILTGLFLIAFTHHAQAQQVTEASIRDTLQLFGEKLEKFGKVRVSYGIESPGRVSYQRFHYSGSEGCLFRYRISHQEISPTVNVEKSGSSFGYSEWSVDLAKVDPERIEIESKKGWTGGFINFYIADGTEAIKYHNSRGGYRANVSYSHGGIAISDPKVLDIIAADLKQAVCLCRK